MSFGQKHKEVTKTELKLVFIHGAGTSGLSFYYQSKHFRNSKAIDLPGHPAGAPCKSINDYVEWVRGFIAARGYKDVVLCGHSMGGAISLAYAHKYPEELKGLVLMNTGAKLKVSETILDSCKVDTAEQKAIWLKYHEAHFECPDKDIKLLLTQKTENIGPSTEKLDLEACNDFDMMGELSNFSIPSQIICGEEDKLTPPKYSQYLNDNLEDSDLTIIQKSGHFSQLDSHKQVNQSIEQFIAKTKQLA